jgi:hypothetical protein
MSAEVTRPGGRRVMRENLTEEPMPVGLIMPRGRLIERLDSRSLAAVANWVGTTVDALVRQYAR